MPAQYLSNFLPVFVALCLLSGFPAYSVAAADQQCSIGTIDINITAKEEKDAEIKRLKKQEECRAKYPAACDKVAITLNNDCATQCKYHKQYTGGQLCNAKPVTTHRPAYLEARDCALQSDGTWTVSCTATAQSCTCN